MIATAIHTSWNQHALWRLAIAGLIVAEILAISLVFDAQAILGLDSLGSRQQWLGQFGAVAKIGVTAAVMLALLLREPLAGCLLSSDETLNRSRFLVCLTGNLVAFGCFFAVSAAIFNPQSILIGWPGTGLALWFALGAATLVLAICGITSPAAMTRFVVTYRTQVLISMLSALAIWSLAAAAQNLWQPLNRATFAVSAFLLSLFVDRDLLVIVPEDRILGLGDFVSEIAKACSGHEGIGLIVAFTTVYLYLHRHELRFPRVLLLFPVGIAVIWILNSVRIASLIAIGHYWSPAVAVGGFHSQAGWLTFIITSLLVLHVAGSRRFFRLPDDSAAIEARSMQTPRARIPAIPMPGATLVPLVALLGATLIGSAFVSEFDWLYPLRVIATCAALAYVWRWLGLRIQIPGIDAVVAGVGIAALWIVLTPADAESSLAFTTALGDAPVLLGAAWLTFRVLGAVVTVPIAEELAFRGWLLCRLGHKDVTLNGALPFSLLAVAGSSLVFGLLHGSWIAGTIAGAVFAIIRIRSGRMSDAIVAHALANALLFGAAALSGGWHLI